MRVREIAPGVMEKRLDDRRRHEPEAVLALRSEAALLAALHGRPTPYLLDSGEDERGPFFRMQKLAFPTLEVRLDRGDGSFAKAWVDRAIRAAFTALRDLHEASDDRGPLAIVHADLSPSNVAVDDAGCHAALLDLELASSRDSQARDGAFRGTLTYAAPEIARGEPPTARSDLFALAATFLHLVVGARPRSGASFAALLAHAAEVPLLDAHTDALATYFAADPVRHAVLRACLAHDPALRPGSARDVLLELEGAPHESPPAPAPFR